MENNNLPIPSRLFYGNKNHESDEEEVDFEGSSSSEYIPSSSESSEMDWDSSENEDAEPDIEIGIPTNTWTPVTGRTLKVFNFLDRHSQLGRDDVNIRPIRPIDFFHMMVTDEVYELIVYQTNLNAQLL